MTTTVILSKQAATALTVRIRRAGEDFGALLLQAHEGRAWESLGYATWEDYVAGEFSFSRSRSYQLLGQARINRALPSSERPVTAREAAAVSNMLDMNIAYTEPKSLRAAVADIRAPLKDKRSQRQMPDKTSVANAICAAIDNFESRAEGYEDEEIVAYLSPDERRVLERAVTKAGEFAERWGDLLSRPMERRFVEDIA